MVAMSQARASEATRLKQLRSRGGSDSSSISLGSMSDPAFHVHSEDDSRGPTTFNEADRWGRKMANRRDEAKQNKKARRHAGIPRAAAPVLAVFTQATVDAAVQRAEPRKANARTCGDEAVAADRDGATRLKRLRSRGGSDSSSMSLGSVSDPAFHVHSEDDSRGPTIVNQADKWTRDLANRRDETKQGKKVRRDAGIARAAAPVLAVLTQATVDAAVQQAEPRKANARTCGDDAVAAVMDEPRSVPNATRDAAMRSTTQGGGTNP